MTRLDFTNMPRVPARARAAMIQEPLLDGMRVWLRLSHRDEDNVQTYWSKDALVVVDETDDAELHLVMHDDVAMAVLLPELSFEEEAAW